MINNALEQSVALCGISQITPNDFVTLAQVVANNQDHDVWTVLNARLGLMHRVLFQLGYGAGLDILQDIETTGYYD